MTFAKFGLGNNGTVNNRTVITKEDRSDERDTKITKSVPEVNDLFSSSACRNKFRTIC